MFGYTAVPSIYGPSLTGIAGTARANDCLRPGLSSSLDYFIAPPVTNVKHFKCYYDLRV
jgi:hypothetical protein